MSRSLRLSLIATAIICGSVAVFPEFASETPFSPCLAVGGQTLQMARPGAHADISIVFTTRPDKADLRINMTDRPEMADFTFADDATNMSVLSCGTASTARYISVSSEEAAMQGGASIAVYVGSSAANADYTIYAASAQVTPRTLAALLAASHGTAPSPRIAAASLER